MGCFHSVASAAAAEPPLLKVLNWGDYVAEDTLARFEAETGIKVVYETAEADDAFEARLSQGDAAFDVVVPQAGQLFATRAARGFYRQIDPKSLQNYGNIDTEFLRRTARSDWGNHIGVPYLWGTAGFGYAKAKVAAALGADAAPSLDLIFNPESARRLAGCGIALIDDPEAVVPAALAFLGKPPMSRDLGDLNAAMQMLTALRPLYRSISGSEYIELLATGSVCMAFGYSGEVMQARSHAEDARRPDDPPSDITFALPLEGSLIWVDMMAIPAAAPHPQNALRFLDFMLRPEIVAAVTNTVGFANANALATDLVDEDLRTDPAIYPDAAARRRLYLDEPVSPDYERQRAALWAKFKASKPGK